MYPIPKIWVKCSLLDIFSITGTLNLFMIYQFKIYFASRIKLLEVLPQVDMNSMGW